MNELEFYKKLSSFLRRIMPVYLYIILGMFLGRLFETINLITPLLTVLWFFIMYKILNWHIAREELREFKEWD